MKPLIGNDVTTFTNEQWVEYVNKRRFNRTIRFGRKKKVEGKPTVAKIAKLLNLDQQLVLDLLANDSKKD